MQIRFLAALLGLLAPLVSCSSPEQRAEEARQAAFEALARADQGAALQAIEELRSSQPDTPEAVVELANLLVRAGEAGQAAWLLEDAIARFPERHELRLGLGRAALLVKDVSRARAAVAGIPSGSEQHPAALLVRSQAELALGDLDQGLATLEQAETLYPDRPELRIPKISTLLAEGRFDEAEQALAEAEASASSDEALSALRNLEVSLHSYRAAQGDREGAIAALGEMVDEDPANAQAWSTLVGLLWRDGQAEQARDRLRRAVAARPDDFALHRLLASTHAVLGEEAEAEQVLRDLLEQAPSPTTYLTLAQFHAGRGHEEKMLAVLAEAAEAYPELSMVRHYRVESFVQAGMLDEARAELALFDELAPDNPEGEYLRARLELAEGDIAGARARLEKVLPALDNAPAHFWLGHALEVQGDLDGAERRYGLAKDRDPMDSAAALSLLRLSETRGDWEGVAAAGQLAAQRAPGRIQGWAGFALGLANLGQTEHAEKVAVKILERFPDQLESYLIYAIVLRAQGKFSDALEQLDEARSRFGRSPELATEQALTLGLSGYPEPAITAARAGLADDPDHAGLHGTLAAVLFLTGDPERAEEGERETDRALELDPADPEPLATRARYHAASGNLDRARADCEAYLAVRPADSKMLFILGLVHEKSGRADDAIAAYRRAAEADEKAFAPRNNLALLLDEQADLDGAIEAAQQAFALAEDDPSVMDTLAALYLKKGLVDRSISLLEEAHAKAPERPAVQLHLAMAYREAGRSEDARRLLFDLRPRTGEQPQLRAQVDEAIATLP